MELQYEGPVRSGPNALTRLSRHFSRAGDGNRTRMTSLEGWSSTIELRPRRPEASRPVAAWPLRAPPQVGKNVPCTPTTATNSVDG